MGGFPLNKDQDTISGDDCPAAAWYISAFKRKKKKKTLNAFVIVGK